MMFLMLLFIPVLVDIIGLVVFNKRINWKEFIFELVIQMLIAGTSIAVIYHMNTIDTELLNGQVTSKSRDRVSCAHSYQCHCHRVCSGSGKNRSCSNECDTCYEHSFDIDWVIHSSVGNFDINRVDRQGLSEPNRWSIVQAGEPVSKTHGFTNYIKASPDTLFQYQGQLEKYKDQLPEYPTKIFDYYKINRIVLVNGATPLDLDQWTKKVSDINGSLGPKKQVNVVVVIAKSMERDWFYALNQHWLGGKKNDVIVVIDTPDNQTVDWVEVMSWTDNQLFKVELRDNILAVGKLDNTAITQVIGSQVEKNFERKHFKDFQYLSSSVTPSATEFMVSLLVGILVSLGLNWFFYNNNPFEEERRGNSEYRSW